MPPSITTRSLEVRRNDLVALAGVDLEVPAGSSLAVIGPNGSGKSTLLGALAGTLAPAAGTIDVVGRPAFVLQSTEVDRSLPLTVHDTVALARYATLGAFRRFRSADREAIATALDRLDVTHLADRQLHELSGGQRQRVLVAQGLAQGAPILLLDEPVTGLDLGSEERIHRVIDEEVASGRTVVVTTHDLDDARRCDQVLLLDTRPVAVGTPDGVLTGPHLRTAFGGHTIRVGDELLLDDPHHHH